VHTQNGDTLQADRWLDSLPVVLCSCNGQHLANLIGFLFDADALLPEGDMTDDCSCRCCCWVRSAL
jgi:hypothetical protein